MKQKGNVLILLIVIAVLAVGTAIYYKSGTSKQKNPESTEQTRSFQSKNLKFSVELPNNFKPVEQLGSVTISTSEGAIHIDKNGTNFENLEEYVKELEEKNKFTLNDRTNLNINNLETISGLIQNEKVYFIYNDFIVYVLSTTSGPLFDDLDQIAQSFRYTP